MNQMPHEPLYVRVRAELVRRLVSGKLAPGAALPAEAALASELWVSVGTVRKASDVLFTVSVYIRDISKQRVVKQGSSEIYGNTDAMWLRAVNYIVDRRLFKEKVGASQ